MALLIEVATRIYDLFNQNYAPNDRFIDIDDVKFHVATTYSTMLNTAFQQQRKENKQMDGFSNIEISSMWMVSNELPIEYDEERDDFFIKLKQPVYSLDWDTSASALHGIHSIGGKHQLYRKIGLIERRFRQVIPPNTAIFYYLKTAEEIRLWNEPPGGRPIKGAIVEVQYIPVIVGQDNDCKLSDNIIAPLIEQVLALLFKAKSGNFIQKLDDQNPNTPTPQVNPIG